MWAGIIVFFNIIEDWRNGYWKFGFTNTGINYILKNIK